MLLCGDVFVVGVCVVVMVLCFFFQGEGGLRVCGVFGVRMCALLFCFCLVGFGVVQFFGFCVFFFVFGALFVYRFCFGGGWGVGGMCFWLGGGLWELDLEVEDRKSVV